MLRRLALAPAGTLKHYHDSSAAQYSPGTLLTQPTAAAAQWQAEEIPLSSSDSSSKLNWMMAVPQGCAGAAPGPAESKPSWKALALFLLQREYRGLYRYKGFTKPCKPRILLNVTAFSSSNIGLKHNLEASVLNIFQCWISENYLEQLSIKQLQVFSQNDQRNI